LYRISGGLIGTGSMRAKGLRMFLRFLFLFVVRHVGSVRTFIIDAQMCCMIEDKLEAIG
jgi:hypothetical protein